MDVERKFLRKGLDELKIKEFLKHELERAGVSSILIQKTPVATRVILFVRRPQIVVGKGGRGIHELSEKLESSFKVENPQIEVVEVESPELDAQLMANKLAHQIELHGAPKRLIRFALNDIMRAGAVGAEIRIAGKIIGKGAKARTLRAREGYLKKSGELKKLVRVGRATACSRAGAIGVTIKIIPPGTVFSERALAEKIASNIASEAKEAKEALEKEAAGAPAPALEVEAEEAEAKEAEAGGLESKAGAETGVESSGKAPSKQAP